MSPRSLEFFEQAVARLADARAILAQGRYTVAIGVGYYAMLYAARAALSERNRYGKTHSGTWTVVRDVLVVDGSLPAELVAAATRGERLREAVDYDAYSATGDEARSVVDTADRFVAAVRTLLDA